MGGSKRIVGIILGPQVMSFVERFSSLGGSKCIVGIILGPQVMSFVERFSSLGFVLMRLPATVSLFGGVYYQRRFQWLSDYPIVINKAVNVRVYVRTYVNLPMFQLV